MKEKRTTDFVSSFCCTSKCPINPAVACSKVLQLLMYVAPFVKQVPAGVGVGGVMHANGFIDRKAGLAGVVATVRIIWLVNITGVCLEAGKELHSLKVASLNVAGFVRCDFEYLWSYENIRWSFSQIIIIMVPTYKSNSIIIITLFLKKIQSF